MIYRTALYDLDPNEDAIEILIHRGDADFSTEDTSKRWLHDERADYAIVAVYDDDPDGFPPPDPIAEYSYDGETWAERR